MPGSSAPTAARCPRSWASRSATGGFANNGGGAGALTLNCPEVKEAAGAFLTALATRYKGPPGLLGYDVWNEVNYSPDVDYSDWMKADFRDWLKAKYGDLETLGRGLVPLLLCRMGRYRAARIEIGPYPENLDWLAFKRDNYYGQMQWRIDTIRAIDQDCLIAAHGVGGAIPNMAAGGSDDWLAASKVELYGLHLGARPPRLQALAELLRPRHHPRRRARQEVVARRTSRRPALAAAAGARPRQGRRPRRWTPRTSAC